MRIRRRQTSKRSRLLAAVGTYLKFKAISKFAKGAVKSVKGVAAYKAVKEAPAPVKALPVVAGVGAGVAGAAVVRKRREPAEPTAA